MPDYSDTARALAHTIDDPPPGPRRSDSSSPVFHRRSTSTATGRSIRPSSWHSRFLADSAKVQRQVVQTFNRFSPLQRVLIICAGVVLLVLGILFLVFNERIFGALAPVAKKWRALDGGWCILWAATFLVSFPPLIGYSTAVTLAGFVYGVPKGWLIAASGTIIGSTASFIVCRTILRSYAERLVSKDKRFAALALTLKHDGLKLLIMIRLCPLPYSLSNGAMATIPTVKWWQFLLAGTIASPKLILHVFVGSRLGAIAESGDKMDFHTKAISYLSIAIGLAAGLATGWFMYTKTKARARELEAEEREAAVRAGGVGGTEDDEYDAELGGEYQYSDDPLEVDAAETLRYEDEFSMHSTKHTGAGGEYRDSFSSDGDAGGRADDGDGDAGLGHVFVGAGFGDEEQQGLPRGNGNAATKPS